MRIGYDRDKTEEYNDRFGVVILAAGLSSRMKEFKPLLPVAGQTAIEGLIETIRSAGLEDIIVVTGHNREALSSVLAKSDVVEVFNSRYEEGMFTSIRAGLTRAKSIQENADKSKDGYLLIPADCPLISINVLRRVMSEAMDSCTGRVPKFAVPTFEGKKGHPLFIPDMFVEDICRYRGEGGLKAVTDKYPDRMVFVPVNEEGCLLDMDTPEGYRDILKFVDAGYSRPKLEILTARKRIILVRHGETKQHEEPVFIGQYDVPLSDEGRTQAEQVAGELLEIVAKDVKTELAGPDDLGKEPMPAIERIYCSDLSRTVETAEIIQAKLEAEAGYDRPVPVKKMPGLREVNLGAWEGRPISEIKEKYPEEYRRRGEDLFAFKTGNEDAAGGRSESFYDMQYRAVAALRDILRNDDAKNIIIVAHAGVIRALENNIEGSRVNDQWEELPKGGYRILEPFPEPPREKTEGDKPMNMNDLSMEAVLEYYR